MRGERLNQGKLADVFVYGEHVLKLHGQDGRDRAEREAEHLRLLAARGVRAPRLVAVEPLEDGWGVVMTRVAGETLGKFALADPRNYAPAMATYVRLHSEVHAVSGAGFPPMKDKLAVALGQAPALDGALRTALLARLAALPDDGRLLHGDFHPFNIVGQGEGAVAVDWLEATCGPTAPDICRSWLQLQGLGPDVAEAYLLAYARMVPQAPSRQAVMDWLPVIAGAMLAEHMPHHPDRLLQLARGTDISELV